MSKKWFALGVLGLALVVNPYLACSNSNESESDFTYSESDMKTALLGDWQGTAELDGVSIPFSLVLEQASSKSTPQSVSAPPLQPQCGSRSFVKPAAACVSQSGMPVIGTLSSVSPSFNGPVDGTFTAYRTLDHVRLELRLENGTELFGNTDGDTLSDGQIGREPGNTFSLSRP